MSRYSQANRPMRIDTSLGADALLLAGFSGSEGVSSPFLYRVDLLSEDPGIEAEALLRKPVTLTVRLVEGERRIHGLVRRFVQLDRHEELTAYRAEVVPWLWFLSLSRDCRIFQNLSVPEIVEQVWQELGYSDFEIRCTRSYPKREYCVQYRESNLDFVSRLMEEEGIFYFFSHSPAKHTLVLADAPNAVESCPGGASARVAPHPTPDEDVVTRLDKEHAVHTGKVTLRDYDYLQPSLSLEGAISAEGPDEAYDYPGKFTQREEGDRYARLALEAEEALQHVVRGEGTCRAFQCGHQFKLVGHYRSDANRAYALLEVEHVARAGDYRSWDSAPLDYRNRFMAVPADVPYRPPRRTPKPVVHGSQTAVVVGKAGEEIWVDRYGRVKVQFPWDRLGRKDENSSCWVRVSTAWAGKGWGTIQIPRMGQEVIVDFLEGDPDRPIITGRVYNAEQLPPYDLPANQTQSGMKSRSSKGGSAENFNEIRMEDRKGSELLYIHAEKDKRVQVEHDRDESVGNDESISIGNDQTISVGRNRSERVGGDESIRVSGNRSEGVGKNENVTVSGNRMVSISKNETLDVGGERSQSVAKREAVSIGDARTTDIGKDDTLNVGKKLAIVAGEQIVLKTGSAQIVLKKDGTITIKGKDVTVQGSGKISVKASSDVTIKGSQVKQN